jgi:hypothetical protein
MLKQDDARQAILREWWSLPPKQRQSGQQAATFAMKAAEQYPFRCKGDRYQKIMAWLSPHIGKD